MQFRSLLGWGLVLGWCGISAVALLAEGDPMTFSFAAPTPQEKATQRLTEIQTLLRQTQADLTARQAQSPGGTARLSPLLADIRQRVDRLTSECRQKRRTDDLREEYYQLTAELRRLPLLLTWYDSFTAIRSPCQYPSPNQFRNDILVGFASGMDKVLPRADLLPVHPAQETTLSLARNEWEAIQLAVVPLVHALPETSVCISDLTNLSGQVFSAKNIHIAPVGYVHPPAPHYGVQYQGWWPDPILDFMKSCDIARGDVQSFWLSVHAPTTQPAGIYYGTLQIYSGTRPLFHFTVKIQVRNFAVPIASPLPLAITFWPTPSFPGWQQHKEAWADFLADHYITYTSIYEDNQWAPDFTLLQRLRQQQRLGLFCLGYFDPCEAAPEKAAEWRRHTIDRIRPRYQQAKELGLLSHAYIYGCDEMDNKHFADIQRAAAILKQEFPQVFIMTTAISRSYGLTSGMPAIDAWCPIISRYFPEQAQQVRQQGKQVWWYICMDPVHPYPNMMVEYPALEGRLLMGAMTAKYRPDGFLYYQISLWPEKPLTAKVFTDWIPGGKVAPAGFNGDGSWVCCGPDLTPVSTIRLENFRDGLEDYAYYLILEKLYRQAAQARGLTPAQQTWLTAALPALSVPDNVVKSTQDYAVAPEPLLAYRNRLATLIEQAAAIGLPAVNLP